MRDFVDAILRRAHVGERQRMPSFVQYPFERRAAVAKLALQRARTHVENFGDLLLGRLAGLQSLRHDFAHPRFDIVPFDAGQILRRDRVTQASEFRIAGVE